MNTALAQATLIPTAQPYTAGAGYAHVGAGGTETTTMAVLNTTTLGVVDWVFVELRDAAGTTVLQTASALLLKDGNVVGTDGVSPVQFPAPSGMYNVAVHHRNHLAVMTGTPMSL